MTRKEYAENAEVRSEYNKKKYSRLAVSKEWRTRRLEKQKASYELAKQEGRCVICRTAQSAPGQLSCEACVDRKRRRISEWIRRLKLEVYAAYGGAKCNCCGEAEEFFLTLDHVEGGGSKDRKENGSGGANFYRRLIKQGFPVGFQVLCMNCNWGRHRNGGVCPHKVGKCQQLT